MYIANRILSSANQIAADNKLFCCGADAFTANVRLVDLGKESRAFLLHDCIPKHEGHTR